MEVEKNAREGARGRAKINLYRILLALPSRFLTDRQEGWKKNPLPILSIETSPLVCLQDRFCFSSPYSPRASEASAVNSARIFTSVCELFWSPRCVARRRNIVVE